MTEINYPEEINIKILFHQSITLKRLILKYYFINQLPRRGERFIEKTKFHTINLRPRRGRTTI